MNLRRGARNAGIIALLSVALVFVVNALDHQIWTAQQRSLIHSINEEGTDLAFQLRDAAALDSVVQQRDVVVVDIDDASIQELGRVQTWPRTYTARVIAYVGTGRPAAIAVDLLYTEPDTLGAAYEQLLRDAGIPNPTSVLNAFRTDDQLAHSLREAGRVYLGFFDAGPDPLITPPPIDDAACSKLMPVAVPRAQASTVLSLDRPVLPIPMLRTAARGVAPIMLHSAGDGTVRHYPVLEALPPSACTAATDTRVLVPSFALRLALEAANISPDALTLDATHLRFAPNRTVPLEANGTFRINWLGETESVRRISYHKVFNEQVPAAFFRDKHVFIGASATGLEDLHTTPVNDQKPGVEIHAEAFLTLANGAFLTEYDFVTLAPWLVVGAFALASLFLVITPVAGALVTLGVMSAEFVAYVLYVVPEANVVLPIGALLLLTGAVFVASAIVRYITEERERLRLQEAFSAYVSPAVTEMIGGGTNMLKLGGEQKDLSVLFCDIRSFTPMSEKMTPEELVSFLNVYFDSLSDAVLEEDGTIDKFIGDAIMAFFGAPIAQDDHAARACRAALAMTERLRSVPVPSEAADGVRIRIGVSTGPMVAGNIGASRRFDYTVIGDAVNLGARVEGLNRLFKTTVLVSQPTYAACQAAGPTDIVFRMVGTTQVKGKQEPVDVYEIMPRHTYPQAELLARRFEEAYALYHRREFEAACDAFNDCLDLQPDDGPTQYYLKQSRACCNDREVYQRVIRMGSK